MLKLFSWSIELTPMEKRAIIKQKREELQTVQGDLRSAQGNVSDAIADNDQAFANYWRKHEANLSARASSLEEEIRTLESTLSDADRQS